MAAEAVGEEDRVSADVLTYQNIIMGPIFPRERCAAQVSDWKEWMNQQPLALTLVYIYPFICESSNRCHVNEHFHLPSPFSIFRDWATSVGTTYP